MRGIFDRFPVYIAIVFHELAHGTLGAAILIDTFTASLRSRTTGIDTRPVTWLSPGVPQFSQSFRMEGMTSSQSNLWGSPWCFKAILFLVSFHQQLQISFCINPTTWMQPSGSFHSMRRSLITPDGKFFFKENLHPLNFCILHETKWSFHSMRWTLINPDGKWFHKENIPALYIEKIWIWCPTSVKRSYLF